MTAPLPDWPPDLWAAARRLAKVKALGDRLIRRGASVCTPQVIVRLAALEIAAGDRFAAAYTALSPEVRTALSTVLTISEDARR